MCHKPEACTREVWSQLMKGHHYWDGVLKLSYWIDAHDLKNGNGHVRKC